MLAKTTLDTRSLLAVIYGSTRVAPGEVVERMAGQLAHLFGQHAAAQSTDAWALPEPDGSWLDGLDE